MATALQEELILRVRSLLSPDLPVREVAMFGGRAVMVNEKMIVSASRSGELLARVPARRHDELLARPGARQAEMGAGRTMGPGWLTVSAESLAAEEELAYWIAAAMSHNESAARGRG